MVKISQNYQLITAEEVAQAVQEVAAQQAATLAKIVDPSKSAGQAAQAVAPYIVVNALALTMMSYVRAFTLLSYLNWSVTTYGVPALVSSGATKTADAVQPAKDAIGTVANVATRNIVACAQFACQSKQDAYFGPSFVQTIKAINA